MTSESVNSGLQRLLTEQSFVRGLARSLVADASSADDLAQQTWMRVLETQPSVVNPRAWLARVVRRLASDQRRSESRRRTRESLAPPPSEVPSPEELATIEEQRKTLILEVSSLENPYRETLLLRYRSGLSVAEIARREKVSGHAIESRLRRAKEKLRARLEQRSGGESWIAALAPLCYGGGQLARRSTRWSWAAGLAIAAVMCGVAIGLYFTVAARFGNSGERPRQTASRESVTGDATDRASEPLVAPTDERQLELSDSPAPTHPGFGAVQGRLIDAKGLPRAGVALTLWSLEPLTSVPSVARQDTFSGMGLDRERVLSEADGTFRFQRVSSGVQLALTYREIDGVPRFRTLGSGPGVDQSLEVGEFRAETPLPPLVGYLVDSAGQPLGAGIEVSAMTGQGRLLATHVGLWRLGEGLGYWIHHPFPKVDPPAGEVVDSEALAPLLANASIRSPQWRTEPVRYEPLILDLPDWTREVLDALPILRGSTDARGRFELPNPGAVVGLFGWVHLPESDRNVFQLTLQPEQTDLGRIAMRAIERQDVQVVVTDSLGRPVAGAEVLLGDPMRKSAEESLATGVRTTPDPPGLKRTNNAPFPWEIRDTIETWAPATTDVDGVARLGRQPSYASAPIAIRRGPGEPWSFDEIDTQSEEHFVQLPGPVSAVLRAEGGSLHLANLRIVQGVPYGDLVTTGFQPPLDLTSRAEEIADGGLRIRNLVPGIYTVLVGQRSEAAFSLSPSPKVEPVFTLRRSSSRADVGEVQVVDSDGELVAGALVTFSPVSTAHHWQRAWVRHAFGLKPAYRFGSVEQRTNPQGKVRWDRDGIAEWRISASHPSLGKTTVRSKQLSVVAELKPFGTLSGRLTDHGVAPQPGQWLIRAVPTSEKGVATFGAGIERTTVVASIDGSFTVPNLTTGTYRIEVEPYDDSFDRLAPQVYPAAFQWFRGSLPPGERRDYGSPRNEQVSITAGDESPTFLIMDVDPAAPTSGSDRPILRGSVLVNGRAPTGARIVLQQRLEGGIVTSDGDATRTTEVDDTGAFEIGDAFVGAWAVSVHQGNDVLAKREVKLTSVSEVSRADFEITLLPFRAVIRKPDGPPLPGATVDLRSSKTGAIVSRQATGDGAVTIDVPPGEYLVSVTANGFGARLRRHEVSEETTRGDPTQIRTTGIREVILRFSGDVERFDLEHVGAVNLAGNRVGPDGIWRRDLYHGQYRLKAPGREELVFSTSEFEVTGGDGPLDFSIHVKRAR